ncbi:MAG TPA: PEGA domain-containing protein [Bdellovibrionota bacterium]|nr:PEGA domain-containing protein [Bdellovibrionota bacterium]
MTFRGVISTVIVSILVVGQPTAGRTQPASFRVVLVSTSAEASSRVELLDSELRKLGLRSSVINPDDDVRMKDADAAQSKGRALLTEAKTLYRKLRFAACLDRLNEARKQMDLSVIRDSYLLEATVQQTQKKETAAITALEAYRSLGGGDPDEAYYPPSFLALFKQAKENLANRPRSSVVVRMEPVHAKAASVSLDGRIVGTGSIRILRVRVGEHHIRIESLGYQPYSELFVLREGGGMVEPRLAFLSPYHLAKQIVEEPQAARRGELLSLMQQAAGTDAALLVGRDEISLYQDSMEIWSRTLGSDFALQPGSDAASVQAALNAPSKVAPSALLVSQTSPSGELSEFTKKPVSMASLDKPKGDRAWYRTWWFWSLVGAAAVGGGAAYYFNGSGSSTDSVSLSVKAQ